jgi:hypothetical protein
MTNHPLRGTATDDAEAAPLAHSATFHIDACYQAGWLQAAQMKAARTPWVRL